jgi:hypothetical protein
MRRNKIVQIKVLDSEYEEIKKDAERLGVLGISSWGRIVIKQYFSRIKPDRSDDGQLKCDA